MHFKTLVPTLSLAFLCSCGLDPVNSKPAPSSPNTKDDTTTQAESKGKGSSSESADQSTSESVEESSGETGSASSEESSSQPSSETTSESTGDSTKPKDDQTWALKADKSAVWFIGAKKAFERVGTFREISGQATVKDGVLESLEVEIPTASVNTPFVRLTSHMLNEDFFDVEKFSTATFRSTKIRKLPIEDSEEDLPNYEIQGDLKILAVTKAIDFVATVKVEDASVVHRASFEINRKDFGMNYDGKPEDPIFDEVKLEIDLSFVPQVR